MKYEIRFWREVRNGFLHVLFGAAVAHTSLPYLPLWAILLILTIIGGIREFWQIMRNKVQPFYIHAIDILTITLGGLIWYQLIIYFNINVDIL